MPIFPYHIIMMELIGYAAAILTTVAFIPQAIKTLKTKSSPLLSLPAK